jgi:urease accessory protein
MNQALDQKLIEDAVPDHGQWQAYLRLAYEKRSRGVRLVKCEHEGPLYVQKAFYPEGPDCAHSYLLHPPGGLVTGDELSISIDVEEDAHALITMPGAGRVYRARDAGGVQTQNLDIKVAENSVIEWLPLETILFPNAHARMNTRFDLADNASLMTWEITCFGLPANEQDFAQGSCRQRMQIWREGRIRFNESLIVDDHNLVEPTILGGNAGLRNAPVHGLFIAGPFANQEQDILDALHEVSDRCSDNELLACSQVAEFITVRYLGHCTEKARKLFTECWSILRPALLQREAVEPRIWRT